MLYNVTNNEKLIRKAYTINIVVKKSTSHFMLASMYIVTYLS